MDTDSLQSILDQLRVESIGYSRQTTYQDGSLEMHDSFSKTCPASMMQGLYWVDKKNISTRMSDSLTLKPSVSKMAPKTQTKEFKVFYNHPSNDQYVGVPKFFGLSAFGQPQVDKRSAGKDIQSAWGTKTLRPEQEIGIQWCLETLRTWGGAFFIADCGFGKSVCIASLIHKLQKKTMIVVPRLTLVEQMVTDLGGTMHVEKKVRKKRKRSCETTAEDTFDTLLDDVPQKSFARELLLHNVSVGVLQGSWEKCKDNVLDKDIVVASLDSLSLFAYPPEFHAQFGLVLFDEAHHMAAETLSQILPHVTAKHIVGFSATPDRKDGLEHSLYWLLGPTCFVYKRIPSLTKKTGTVVIEKLQWEHAQLSPKIMYTGSLNYADLMNQVAQSEKRNQEIVQLVTKCILKDERGKVLVLTAFREHADTLYSDIKLAFRDAGVQLACQLLHGGIKKSSKKAKDTVEPTTQASSAVRVLVATYGLLEEGFDDPDLDTLIMTTARSRVQQIVGRIERTKLGKKVPIVYDIVDKGHQVFESMWYARVKFYASRGFTCKSGQGTGHANDTANWESILTESEQHTGKIQCKVETDDFIILDD
jgi:superfamily II DNA or RNA helicase